MPFRHLSVPVKIMLSFGLIILLATGLGYFLVHQAIDRAFEDFAEHSAHRRAEEISLLLAKYYERTGSWTGIARLSASDSRREPPPPFVLLDQNDIVILAPNQRWVEQDARTLGGPMPDLSSGTPIEIDGRLVGRIITLPLPMPLESPLEQAFMRSAQGAFWVTGVAAAAIALLLAFLLLRQMTAPLRTLGEAAGQISQGRLGMRVPIRSRDEFGQLAESFNQMAASLEQAEQAKRHMIADVAHELRTPISSVRIGLEGLMDGVLEATAANFAALHNKTLLVSRLVDDLQQLALADAGQLQIHKRSCDLRPLFQHIQATIGAQLEDQSIALLIELPEKLPLVEADEQRIEQVMLNLLSNSTRYTPEGGTIRIQAEVRDSTYVEVSVCNSGPGLTEEDLAHVFERFYRADKSRARSSGRSGLGLAIAKALIEAHHGKIWAENALQGEACFRFTVPRVKASN